MLTFLLLFTACQEKKVGQELTNGDQDPVKIPIMEFEQMNENEQDDQKNSLTTEALGDDDIFVGAISIEGRSGGGSTLDEAIERQNEKPIVDTIEPDVEEVTLPEEKPTTPPPTQTEDTPAISLKGFTLQNTQADVIQKLSSPSDQYSMQDPQGELKIFEYDGLTIGFNTNQQMVFMEIYSSGQDPELSGLKIGQTRDRVKQVLGQPSSENEYMITYQSEDTILRFDIDPVENTIHAIKLFRNT